MKTIYLALLAASLAGCASNAKIDSAKLERESRILEKTLATYTNCLIAACKPFGEQGLLRSELADKHFSICPSERLMTKLAITEVWPLAERAAVRACLSGYNAGLEKYCSIIKDDLDAAARRQDDLLKRNIQREYDRVCG